MSNEQIAEIKNKYHSFLNQSERSTIAISQNHLNWLIQQAYRVKDLEEDLKLSEEEEDRRFEENKRYKQALEFYAMKSVSTSITTYDGGYIARKALGGDEE